ncbi:MAG: hypothetical protein VCC20_03980 [Myxococcota bacterium]
MDRETISKLRLDKRLASRRGWISPDDLDRELEALPDASSKIEPVEEPGNEPAPVA